MSGRRGHLSATTANGITLVIILASVVCSAVLLVFIYQHVCRRRRKRRRDGDGGSGGYAAVGMRDAHDDEEDRGGWTSYDASALDWDPEEARVKRRLNAVEKKKTKLKHQVDLLDQQLTARQHALDQVTDHSIQLTSRLNTARDQPSSIGSNIGHMPADSKALAAVDAKGKEMFGEKWMKGENGGPPMRSILGLAPADLEQIKRGLETAREEARSSGGKSGRVQRGRGVAAAAGAAAVPGQHSNQLQGGDYAYEGHSQLLARTSMLTDQLRAASNTPRRR